MGGNDYLCAVKVFVNVRIEPLTLLSRLAGPEVYSNSKMSLKGEPESTGE